MRVRSCGPTGELGPQPPGSLDRGWREQPEQPLGISPGYIPKEHEVGQQDCILLLLKTIGMARWTAGCRTMCTYPWWWFFHQFHGRFGPVHNEHKSDYM